MAYDEALAERIRRGIGSRPDVTERKMFGGIAFMVRGHMFIGVIGSDVMARVGAEAYDAALARPGVRVMDVTGRPMTGFVNVSSEAIASDEALQQWVDETCDFASALPPKTATDRPFRRKRA